MTSSQLAKQVDNIRALHQYRNEVLDSNPHEVWIFQTFLLWLLPETTEVLIK